jgi:hypothetical protein
MLSLFMQLQVNVNYFARAESPTPVTAPLKKKPRILPAPIQQAPVPLDLATPQQLKAASDQNTSQSTSSAHRSIPPIQEAAVPGAKRLADFDGSSSSARAPKPEQEPRKRQKMEPSLFIPKKRT